MGLSHFLTYVLQNVDPDYSCGYVTMITDTGLEGYGITFTAGRGTDIGALYLYFTFNTFNLVFDFSLKHIFKLTFGHILLL